MPTNELTILNRRISFSLSQSPRKTLSVTVMPDLSVVVKAPDTVSHDRIMERLKKRGRWIIKQQDYFASFLPNEPERKFISGESHLYLGRHYRLKVSKSSENSVTLNHGYIAINTKITDKHQVKYLLTAWYYEHAVAKVTDRYNSLKETFEKYHLTPTGISFKHMKKRWGSCNSKGEIVLNPELIKTPRKCIDYVIIHELCHLKHHNHGRYFYQLLSVLLPDWEIWKQKLEKVGI